MSYHILYYVSEPRPPKPFAHMWATFESIASDIKRTYQPAKTHTQDGQQQGGRLRKHKIQQKLLKQIGVQNVKGAQLNNNEDDTNDVTLRLTASSMPDSPQNADPVSGLTSPSETITLEPITINVSLSELEEAGITVVRPDQLSNDVENVNENGTVLLKELNKKKIPEGFLFKKQNVKTDLPVSESQIKTIADNEEKKDRTPSKSKRRKNKRLKSPQCKLKTTSGPATSLNTLSDFQGASVDDDRLGGADLNTDENDEDGEMINVATPPRTTRQQLSRSCKKKNFDIQRSNDVTPKKGFSTKRHQTKKKSTEPQEGTSNFEHESGEYRGKYIS